MLILVSDSSLSLPPSPFRPSSTHSAPCSNSQDLITHGSGGSFRHHINFSDPPSFPGPVPATGRYHARIGRQLRRECAGAQCGRTALLHREEAAAGLLQSTGEW